MRAKSIYIWSGVQIVIGVLLLLGTAHMAIAVLPRFNANAGKMEGAVVDAAKAVKAANVACSESEANLVALTRTLEDVADRFDEVGSTVSIAGGKLHFDLPGLKALNGVGESIRGVGKDVANIAANIREQSKSFNNYLKDGHPHLTASLSEASMVLDDIASRLKDGREIFVCGLYLCFLGFVVSLLFITNGIILRMNYLEKVEKK